MEAPKAAAAQSGGVCVCADREVDTPWCCTQLQFMGPNPTSANSTEEGGGQVLLGRAVESGEEVAPTKAESSSGRS